MGWTLKISVISSRSKMNIFSTLVHPGYPNTGTASSKSASDTSVSPWCFVCIKSVEISRSVIKRLFLTPQNISRLDVTMSQSTKITVFWDVTSCTFVSDDHAARILYPEDAGNRNIDIYIPKYMAPNYRQS
jgi:hypothetical protein